LIVTFWNPQNLIVSGRLIMVVSWMAVRRRQQALSVTSSRSKTKYGTPFSLAI